jgi:iron complex outermembrane receptor protein
MNPGGLLNIITKDPKEIRQTVFRFTVATFAGAFDSFGNKFTETASLDTTGPVGDSKHLFFRMILDVEQSPTSRPGNTDHNVSVFPSLTYKWTKDTYLKVKVESASDFRRQDDGILPIFTNGTAFGSNAKYYTAPFNTVYNDTADKATDRGEALSLNFNSKLADGWLFRFQTRSVWHLDVVREFTINNANIFSPTAKYALPTSLLRRQYNYVKNGHRYNYGDLNLVHTFGNQNYKNTVIGGLGGGGEFFGNSRLAFGPNTLTTQTLTLINPVLDQYSYPVDGTGMTNQLTNQTAFGEYLSDQFSYGDKLHISAGLRHDMQKVHGLNTLIPGTTLFQNKLLAYTKQAGIVYDITSNISPYASYSQSIKPQTTIAFDSAGNSSFPPESGKQIEGGIKFENTAKTLDITAAIYDIKRTNVVLSTGTTFTVATGNAQVGQAISRLDGGQESKGYEFETRWQPVTNWQIQLGYAYSKAVISASITNPTTVGLDLANAPRKSGNLWTRYNFATGSLKGLGVGGGLVYVGQAWAGDPTTTVYYNLSGYVRADTAIYYKWKKYDLSLNVQNLFDRRYISGAQSALNLNAGEERKFTLSMSTHF